MKLNMSYPITWLKEAHEDEQISSSVLASMVEFVQTYGIYEAAVRREMAEAVMGDYQCSEELAHETVLLRLINDLEKVGKLEAK